MNEAGKLSGLPLKAALATIGAGSSDLEGLEKLCGYRVDELDAPHCWLGTDTWQAAADRLCAHWEGPGDLFHSAGRRCGAYGLLGPIEFLPWFLSTPALLLRNLGPVIGDLDTVLQPDVEFMTDSTCRLVFTARESLPPDAYLSFLEGYLFAALELWEPELHEFTSRRDDRARVWTVELRWTPREYRTRRALEELMVEPEFFGDLMDGLRRIRARKRNRLEELVKVNEKLRTAAERTPSHNHIPGSGGDSLKEQYLSLLTPVYDGLLSVDSAGALASASPGALALLGYPSFEELRRRYPDIPTLLGEQVRTGDRWTDKPELQQGLVLTVERADGMHAEVYLVRDGDSGAPAGGANLVLRAPAFQRPFHLELGRTRQFLEAIFLNSPSGIQVLDTAGWTLRVNPQLVKMFNLDHSRIVGPGKYNILEDPNLVESGLVKHLRAALAGESIHLASQRFSRSAGRNSPFCNGIATPLVVNLTAYPLKDQMGRVHNVVISYTDMTESDLLQQHLAQLDKLQSIGTLTSGIAHDFNNILGAIVPNADLIVTLAGENEQIRKKAMAIKTASKRAAALTQQLVSFARETRGDRRRLDLNACVREAVELISNAVPRNVTIEFEESVNLPPIVADPLQMQQVLINLIINASDALPAGGSIMVRTEAVELETRTSFGGNIIPPGEYVRLSVIDEGIGIPVELVERVFDPFFTTKEKGRGTGLGLSVVHGIVKSHRGLINISTSPGVGTRFDVHLPALDTSDESAEPEHEDSDR